MTRMRRLFTCLFAVVVCLQASCAVPVRPDHLAQQDKRSLGHVAVVAARFDPDYHFEALTTGKGDAAAKGALSGVGSCAELLRGELVGALLFLVCAPIGAMVGAISSASGAATAEQVEAAKAAAQRGIAALKLQDGTVEAVLRYGKEMGIDLARLPQSLGPAKPEDLPSYTEAKGTADSVIEISVLHANAFTTGERELLISLGMQARVRVFSTRDDKVIDTLTMKYTSYARTIDEWLADDGQAIKMAFERDSASIAEQAIDEILLIYHPKAILQQPPAETGPSQTERVPPYALRAIEPPIRNKFHLSGSRTTYGALERYPLSELQPSFRWEAWPRGFDIVPGNEPGQAQQVRYDLRIRGEGGIIYERRGIVEAEHRLEQPLEACHTYRWTVRARFMLNGVPRATEWTGAYDTIGGQVAPWWIRRGSGKPALAFIPSSTIPFYPIVETPSIDGKACPDRQIRREARDQAPRPTLPLGSSTAYKSHAPENDPQPGNGADRFITPLHASLENTGEFKIGLGVFTLAESGMDLQVNYRPQQSRFQFGYKYTRWTEVFDDPFTGQGLDKTQQTKTGPILNYLFQPERDGSFYGGISLLKWTHTMVPLMVTSAPSTKETTDFYFGGGYTSRIGSSFYYNVGLFISPTAKIQNQISTGQENTIGVDAQVQIGIAF